MNPDPLHGQSILVVEDEVLIAEELRERLTHLGLRIVDVVDTGERAIQVAEQVKPELILMDIRLKGPIDGIQAAETIRRTIAAPVVFLTAHSDHDTLRRAKHADPFGFVVKPFNERELAVALEMALHRYDLEQRLRESEKRYAATLVGIGDGVIATDSKGLVTFMNPVAEALTGWRLTDARGLSIEQVFPVAIEKTRTIRENPALQAMRLKHIVKLIEPSVIVTHNQGFIPIDDSAAPIIDDQGKLFGAVVAFRDIRQRRLAEGALRRAEDQLRQAQKMEAIGQLAGGIAHDFNNLITVINGFVDLLLGGHQLDLHSRSLLTEIRKAGDRAGGLTRQLLAFSCRQVLQPTALHLGDLVVGISRMLERLIGEDIILTTGSVPDLWTMWADPGQIEQVILNLAVNARDAMPQGGRLTIDASNVELMEGRLQHGLEIPPGSYVLLTVNDTGVGMDQEIQERAFEPFATTKKPGHGTGLGLASVYGIVKQSGGFISLSSGIGMGTTFKLYFPALHAAVPAASPLKAVGSPAVGGHETILFVEDDDLVRSLASSALRLYGYTVHDAKGGEEAVCLFKEHAGAIQLVVTDVVMPGMSGREVAEHVLAVNPNMPILYLSGYTDDTVLRHGVLTGEAAFLHKPFTLNALAQKVREMLEPRGRERFDNLGKATE